MFRVQVTLINNTFQSCKNLCGNIFLEITQARVKFAIDEVSMKGYQTLIAIHKTCQLIMDTEDQFD